MIPTKLSGAASAARSDSATVSIEYMVHSTGSLTKGRGSLDRYLLLSYSSWVNEDLSSPLNRAHPVATLNGPNHTPTLPISHHGPGVARLRSQECKPATLALTRCLMVPPLPSPLHNRSVSVVSL